MMEIMLRTLLVCLLLALVSTTGCKEPAPPPPPPPVQESAPAVRPPEPEPPPPQPEPEPEPQEEKDAAPEPEEEVPQKGFPRFSLSTGSEEAGPVDFRHRKHQKQFGCKKCHHEIEPGVKPSSCADCHGVQEEIMDLMTSYHKTCNACHIGMGMGPIKCAECHKWIKKKKKEAE
jgi:hypothetical protein